MHAQNVAGTDESQDKDRPAAIAQKIEDLQHRLQVLLNNLRLQARQEQALVDIRELFTRGLDAKLRRDIYKALG